MAHARTYYVGKKKILMPYRDRKNSRAQLADYCEFLQNAPIAKIPSDSKNSDHRANFFSIMLGPPIIIKKVSRRTYNVHKPP